MTNQSTYGPRLDGSLPHDGGFGIDEEKGLVHGEHEASEGQQKDVRQNSKPTTQCTAMALATNQNGKNMVAPINDGGLDSTMPIYVTADVKDGQQTAGGRTSGKSCCPCTKALTLGQRWALGISALLVFLAIIGLSAGVGIAVEKMQSSGQDPPQAPAPPPLSPGSACQSDGDCKNGTCTDGFCAALGVPAEFQPTIPTKAGDNQPTETATSSRPSPATCKSNDACPQGSYCSNTTHECEGIPAAGELQDGSSCSASSECEHVCMDDTQNRIDEASSGVMGICNLAPSDVVCLDDSECRSSVCSSASNLCL